MSDWILLGWICLGLWWLVSLELRYRHFREFAMRRFEANIGLWKADEECNKSLLDVLANYRAEIDELKGKVRDE